MAINKNFVVKNGLEVNTNQIFADSATGRVGIGSTQPTVVLDVQGGIAATNIVTQLLRVSGYATFSQVQVNNNINVSGFSTVVNQLNVLGMTSVTNFKVTGISTFNENSTFDKDIRVVGFSTFVGVSTFNDTVAVSGLSTFFKGIDVVGHTEVDNLRVSGFSTFVGIGTFSSDLYVGGDLYVSDDIVFDEFRSRNAWVTGVGSISTLYVNAGILTTAAITNLSGTHLNYSGISTFLSSVGIGTTDISYLLTVGAVGASGTTLLVNGDARIGGISAIGIDIRSGNTSTLIGPNVAGNASPRPVNSVAIGADALFEGTTVLGCVAIGYVAGRNNTGDYNTFIGNESGYFVTSGNNNTILGTYNGNQNGLDIRTSSNNVVLSDGSGNIRLYANSIGNVGIGTTNPTSALTVSGLTSTSQLHVTGVSTLSNTLDVNASIDVSGNTATNSLSVSGFTTVSGRSDLQNVTISGITTTNNFVDINASIDVSGNAATNSLAVSGFATVSGRSDLQNVVISGVSTLSNTLDVNASADISGNLLAGSLSVTGISTLGTVLISSGVVTATSGVVTYYGDGQYLDLTNNSSTGIGIGTTGGVVGYGITFLDLKGAGVSTTQYNSSVGIATIFFEGGSGSASIGIGSTPGAAFPPSGIATAGNLWYNTNLARLFIYYQDDDTAQWVDAAPFNVGIITQLSNISFANGSSVSPSWYFDNSTTTGVFSPTSGELTFVSTGSSILNINQSGINVTGIVTATDFDSLSDENLKENITTVNNATDIVSHLRGVRFEWKKDHKPSYGVIAQELEQVLPELVSNTDPKTVNYNGIIGVLIEAIKEQQKQIDDLITKINDK